MASTEPLTGVTVQDQSDAATGGTEIGNLAKSLARFTVPRFTSTAARDTAYTGMVSGGGVMADGMVSSANGVPYRRIAGTWRIDRQRVFVRAVSITGGAGSITSGGSVESGLTSGITLTGGSGGSFTLYESGTVSVNASFRAGPSSAGGALCSVKIDGSTVGNVAVSRADGTVSVNGGIALAPGTHTVSMRVDTSASACTWVDGSLVLAEYTAE